MGTADWAQFEFDNAWLRAMPGDSGPARTSREVRGAGYALAEPTRVSRPRLAALTDALATQLGMPAEPAWQNADDVAAVLAGNTLLPGMQPTAAAYAGHQFGNWAGQLGDGRAIALGQVRDSQGALMELQLKGAGPTPFSRGSDGRAVLRSSVREFLVSEAMHALGVPTTRALSLVTTGDDVVRDMFYMGDPRPEPGAIVCRVAPTFVRFGNFELFASRGDTENLGKLTDYVLAHHYPHLGPRSPDSVAALLSEVAERTASLMVEWMRVGFVHGVMNTDNMSILGLTIDYGPYGWLEPYQPGWTPNTTDRAHRRYRFGNQPNIGLWNVAQLANALYPLVGDEEKLEAAIHAFAARFEADQNAMFARKLGLSHIEGAEDPLLKELMRVLQLAEVDNTLFYRALSHVDLSAAGGPAAPAMQAGPDTGEPAALAPRAGVGDPTRSDVPGLGPVAHAYHHADAAAGEPGEAMRAWLAAYAQRVQQTGLPAGERVSTMHSTNPLYVLRNWVAQQAIDAASGLPVSGTDGTGGGGADADRPDWSLVHTLQTVLAAPYTAQPGMARFASRRPTWAENKPGCSMLSCSS